MSFHDNSQFSFLKSLKQLYYSGLRRHNTEEHNTNFHRREDIKSHNCYIISKSLSTTFLAVSKIIYIRIFIGRETM
jgi:hypothetical protein